MAAAGEVAGVVGRRVARVLGPLDEAEHDGVLLPREELPHRVQAQPAAQSQQQQRKRRAADEQIPAGENHRRRHCCLLLGKTARERERRSKKKNNEMIQMCVRYVYIYVSSPERTPGDGQKEEMIRLDSVCVCVCTAANSGWISHHPINSG